jgi:hypothetical protein
MLQQELTTMEEIAKLVSHNVWVALVPHVVQHSLVEVISHQSERLSSGRRRDLPDELVTVCVLDSWLLSKDGFRTQVKHSWIIFIDYLCWVNDASICQVFVHHVLLTELQVQVLSPLVILVENASVNFGELFSLS